MAWTPFQAILAIVMVVTGSINTLSTSWADILEAKGSDGKVRPFDHPFFQACGMFLGEFLCLIVFKILYYYYKRKGDGSIYEKDLVKGNQQFNPFIFLPAAMFDMIGTSVMYVGLNLTYPSSFQMLRGSVIVFVAILSMLFLSKKIILRQWTGIILVIAGLAIVGVSDFIGGSTSSHTTQDIVTGDTLIILAQISTAVQMVYEEKFVAGKDIPALQAVGWEGLFGLIMMGLLQVPFYYIHVPAPYSNNAHGVLEDFPDALVQLGNNYLLIISFLGTIVSIAFFNFAGISVTKELSATTRMILDSVRTFFIWMASLGLQWQKFSALQIPGFIILIIGMCTYNNLLPSWNTVAFWRRSSSSRSLTEHPDEES